MKCKPCRVTYQGTRYEISSCGLVFPYRAPGTLEHQLTQPLPDNQARAVRREAARQRRNRNAREQYQALRDLGMLKTPYGEFQ